MTRTVRIGPVPVPPPPVTPPTRRPPGLPVGAGLLVAALVCWLGSFLLAGDGSHSWDRHATPPATVDLLAGVTYLLSTHDGPRVAPASSPLTCTFTTAGGESGTLTVTAMPADSKATHAIASFVAPATGAVAVRCAGGAAARDQAVFVDDAEDAAADLAGWLLLAAVVAGLAGAGVLGGTLAARAGTTRVSGLTPVPSA